MAEKTEKKPKDKAGDFKRLAESRTEKALNTIAIIGGLSAKNNYEYSDEQVAKIISALRKEVDTLEKRFTTGEAPKTGFSL